MNRTRQYFLPILAGLILLLHLQSVAGELQDSTQKPRPYERSLIINVDYASDKVFYGRKSAERIVYVSPSVLYNATSGFFAGLSSYRLIRPEHYWDNSRLMVGHDFTLFDKLLTSVSYSRFAYRDSALQIQSSLKNDAELQLTLDSFYIRPRLTSSIYFGNSSPDYLFSFELLHEFCVEYLFGKNDALFITPAAMVSAGTLHYYRLLRKDPGQQLPVTKEVVRFNLSGIDLSLPVEYYAGRFMFSVSANYNIPLNQPLYLKTSPGFYFTAGIGFRIL
jgi:hypothetical protein